MQIKRVMRGWRQAVVNDGWLATARMAAGQVRRKLRPPAAATSASLPEGEWASSDQHPFDREHGVDTSGLIWGNDLTSGSRNDAWNTAYYGVAPSVFRASMAQLPAELRSGATFIDIGSGKGRAVMLATGYPFAQIVGVEISPQLHRVAGDNLAKYNGNGRIGPPVQLLLQDAAEYRLPLGPLVVYLFHPFCRPVLKQVLRNLAESLQAHPRAAAVVYINSELRDLLDRAPFLERIWDETVSMDASDRLADRIGSSEEQCALYRARPRRTLSPSPERAS